MLWADPRLWTKWAQLIVQVQLYKLRCVWGGYKLMCVWTQRIVNSEFVFSKFQYSHTGDDYGGDEATL